MAYAKDEVVRQSPIDFAYIFVTNDYLTAIAQSFGQAKASKIKAKYDNAIRYINGWGKNAGYKDYAAAKQAVRELIQEQYGRTPENILIAWAKGEQVAGVDFSKGVYGIGAEPQLTFNQNSSAMVDATTGKISFGDNSPEAMWKTIDRNGKTLEMNYTFMGNAYTSRYNPSTGEYFANTFGSKDAMQFANGTTYSAKNASSTWENLNTALPAVSNFMQWLANLVSDIVGKFTPIGNVAPEQSDYYTENTGVEVAGFGIVGALLIGGLLIGSKTRKKNKR